MFALIQPFINLLLFRAGPQDMPASQGVFKATVVACFLSDIIGASATLGMGTSILLSAGQIALLGIFVYLLLKINKKESRWVQTLSALFGSLTLINLATFPFVRNLTLFVDGQLVMSGNILIVAALQLWFFIVMARILRDALEIRMGRAVLLTFLIINVVPLVLSMLIGSIGLTPAPMGGGTNL